MPVALAGALAALRLLAQTPEVCDVPTTTADTRLSVTAQPDALFAIVLESNPGTGYSWTVVGQPDPSVAMLLDSQMLPPATAPVGAPGRQCFRFTATGLGDTSVGFAYRRPFEPDAPPAQSLDVAVSVATAEVPVQVPLVPLG